MADHVSTIITLGGKITWEDLPKLIEAIEADGPGPSFCEFFDTGQLAEYLRSGVPIELCDDQARWGRFEQIESVCTELGLTWKRHNEAKYDLIEEISIVDAGVEHGFSAVSGKAVFDSRELKDFPDLQAARARLDWADSFTPPPLEIV